MPKKTPPIHVNNLGSESGEGIAIEKISFKNLPGLEQWNQPERHNHHSFFLLEKGTVTIEVDFQKYKIGPSYLIYMHPNQVHRILAFKNVTLSGLAINNENLNPAYLQLLQDITPAKPLRLKKETLALVSETILLCIKFSERKKDKLHHSLLKDSCNALVALAIAQYTERTKPAGTPSRFEVVTKAFYKMLELNYATTSRPAVYAQKLNISVTYLNECVRNATGLPVSHHIQQRIVLEAKRLLYHSGRSIKEIATELGYDDYHYFSRLFTKVAGIPPLAFRNKNID